MKIMAVIVLTMALAACGRGPGLTVIPQDPHSLEHYAQGLRCKQEGRYLLAREHFQLALATSRDTGMSRRCEAEIASVDRALLQLR
ncbi:MAG: hypothetical protein HY795_15415 [Desulfovibrio sp.]|jgi:hypothetical protein|nr:hypothetical protein [Desulfovibrio sp.]MBI4958788.1 hypothetical protein [Desulfovibrio sp.]